MKRASYYLHTSGFSNLYFTVFPGNCIAPDICKGTENNQDEKSLHALYPWIRSARCRGSVSAIIVLIFAFFFHLFFHFLSLSLSLLSPTLESTSAGRKLSSSSTLLLLPLVLMLLLLLLPPPLYQPIQPPHYFTPCFSA